MPNTGWPGACARAANLSFDPWVSILGFPFIPQAMRHRYNEIEIKASGVDHPVVGKVSDWRRPCTRSTSPTPPG